jgi:hypothetical protein
VDDLSVVPGGALGAPYDSMPSPDAVVALRSLERRWRRVLGPEEDDPDDLVRRRPGPGSWSALEHAAAAGAALQLSARHLRTARSAAHPRLGGGQPADPGPDHESAPGVLARLAAAADAAAAEIEAAPDSAWTRRAELDGRPVDLLWLARNAVRQGVEHLRRAEAAIAEVRAQEARRGRS